MAQVSGVAGAQPVVPRAAPTGGRSLADELPGRAQTFVRERGDAPDVENVDLTDLVNGHLAYPLVMQQILARIRLEA